MSESNAGSKAAYFLAGLGVGAIIALLFAPASGEEAREFLGKKADEGREYVSARGREVRRQAEELVEKAKDLVTQQKDQLSAALEAGKQAYQEEKAKSR
ncbi:MAG TPA: YtxH domain-containing protein [Terriglobia bacterium]|nr:YtxH domain-containing protein [Terriglobia bacterium]